MSEDTPDFDALGLAPALLSVVEAAGFERPTAIQAAAIPLLLEGRDVLGQARTGTGKTAAFLLPLLQLVEMDRRQVQALVLAPTRELAMQVASVARDYTSAALRVRVVTVYGGQAIGPQIRAVERGPQIVVGTPGRVLDLLRRGVLDLSTLAHVVLDEADEMLRMGFVEDIEAILDFAPTERQTALFSATISRDIRRIATRHTRDAVDVAVSSGPLTVASVRQEWVMVRPADKLEVLDRLLEVDGAETTLVFARTRVTCAELAEALEGRGHGAEALHGDLSQAARETVVRRVRAGRVRVVVATDVAARGLDIDSISHVINFDPPDSVDTYVHRIGRTGRAGREGVAITFLTRGQQRFTRAAERHTGHRLTRRDVPDSEALRAARGERLKRRLLEDLEGLEAYLEVVDALVEEGHDVRLLAAAAARITCGARGLEIRSDRRPSRPRPTEFGGEWIRFEIAAGARARVRIGDVVGALCGDLDLPREAIGRVFVGGHRSEVWVAAEVAEALAHLGMLNLRGRPTPLRIAEQQRDNRGPPPEQRPRPPQSATAPAGKRHNIPGRHGSPRGKQPHK